MKRIIEDTAQEGLDALLGERVTIWCMNYIYSGKLVGVNSTCVKLSEACIVYETGPLKDEEFKDAQSLPFDWYIQLSAVESFGRCS